MVRRRDILNKAAVHKKRYEFKVDSLESITPSRDVSFRIDVQPNVNPELLRKYLPEEISYVAYFSMSNIVICQSNPETLKIYLGWELEHDEKCKGMYGYTTNGYKSASEPKIPKKLEKIIDRMFLNCLRK